MNNEQDNKTFCYTDTNGQQGNSMSMDELVEQFQLGQLPLSTRIESKNDGAKRSLAELIKQSDWWNKNHFRETHIYCPFCHKKHAKPAKEDKGKTATTCTRCGAIHKAEASPFLNNCKYCGYLWFPEPKSNYWQHVKSSLAAFANYKTRASVKEYLSYWFFYIIACSINIQACVMSSFRETHESGYVEFTDGQYQVIPDSMEINIHPNICIFILIQLIISIPFISLTIRRLHDRGISGKTVITLIIASNLLVGLSSFCLDELIGSILLGVGIIINIGIFLMCLQSGQITTNNYGPSPE